MEEQKEKEEKGLFQFLVQNIHLLIQFTHYPSCHSGIYTGQRELK